MTHSEVGQRRADDVAEVLSFIDGAVRAEVAGDVSEVGPGDVVVVPAGTEHNFTNIGTGQARLYTLYAPPDHAPDTVHQTKADAEHDEHDVPPPPDSTGPE